MEAVDERGGGIIIRDHNKDKGHVIGQERWMMVMVMDAIYDDSNDTHINAILSSTYPSTFEYPNLHWIWISSIAS